MQNNRQVKQNDQNVKVYLRAGDELFNKEYHQQSLKFYDLAIKINPECFQAYFNKGKVHTILKNYNEAHNMFDKAQELNPLDYQVHFYRGNIYQNLSDYHKAIEQYDYAIKLNNQDPKVFQKYAETLNVLGKFEEAVQMYQQEIQIYEAKKIKQTDFHQQICFAHYYIEKILFAFLNQLISSGKNEKAFEISKLLEEDIIKQQSNPISCLKLGDILIKLEKIDDAFRLFELSVQQEKKTWFYAKINTENYIQRGDQFYNQGKFDEAIKFYDMSLKLNPSNGNIGKGEALIAQGHFDEAYIILNNAKQNYEISVFKDKAHKHLKDNLIEGFNIYYKICLSMGDNISKIQSCLELGDGLINKGLIKEGIEIHKQAIQFKPNQDEFLKRGDQFFKQQKYDLAKQFYELLTEINPLQGYLKQGDNLAAQENMEQAFIKFKEAAKYNPHANEFIKGGDQYFEKKQFDYALQFYELSIQFNRQQGYLKQGDLYVHLQKMEEAKQMFINSIESKQSNQNCQEYQSRAFKLFKQKKYEIALFLYEILITLQPEKIQHQLHRGEVLYALERSQDSLEIQYSKFQQTQYDLKQFSAWAYHKILILQEQGIYENTVELWDKMKYVGLKLDQYK